jgi:hypothetical protein
MDVDGNWQGHGCRQEIAFVSPIAEETMVGKSNKIVPTRAPEVVFSASVYSQLQESHGH